MHNEREPQLEVHPSSASRDSNESGSVTYDVGALAVSTGELPEADRRFGSDVARRPVQPYELKTQEEVDADYIEWRSKLELQESRALWKKQQARLLGLHVES
jgi:hypothetical protein